MRNDYDLGFMDGLMGAPLRGETDEYILGHLDGAEAATR
jgi:hypothetical protein